MPLYEYECEACGRRFELIRRFSDPPADTCTVCGAGPVRKLFSSPAIQFKGSGFYITDYPKKGQNAADKGEKAEKGEKGEKGEKADKGDKGDKGDKAEGAGSGTANAKDQANAKGQAPKGKEAKGDKSSGGSSGDKAAPAPSTSSGSNKAKSSSD
jgi:putative FmdB family regulatory protein